MTQSSSEIVDGWTRALRTGEDALAEFRLDDRPESLLLFLTEVTAALGAFADHADICEKRVARLASQVSDR